MTRSYLLAIRMTFVLMLLAGTYLSLTPSPPGLIPPYDKPNHAAAYFFLALTADWAFPAVGYLLQKGTPLFLYGFLMEVLQLYIPGRTFEGWDLAANASGLLLYAAVVRALKKFKG